MKISDASFEALLGSKTVKISDASFEALFANATDNHIAQTIGSSCLWILSWIADSGASCHICNDSSCFVNLKPCNVKISAAKLGEFIMRLEFHLRNRENSLLLLESVIFV